MPNLAMRKPDFVILWITQVV